MLKLLTVVYAVNLMLLVLHEIESAYWKEWEILKIPGGVTVFVLLHAPILLALFWGLIEVERESTAGLVIGLVAGAAGLIPLLVHKVLVRRKEAFGLLISNLVLGLNVLVGAALVILCQIRLAA